MGTVILICGKICSGKSLYADSIKNTYNSVVLSCDEVIYTLTEKYSYTNDEALTERVREYLLCKAEQIALAGSGGILDFGFETKSERDAAKKRFTDKGIEVKIHYIEVSDEAWMNNIAKRNLDTTSDPSCGCIIDEKTRTEHGNRFEAPTREEVAVWLQNSGAPAIEIPTDVRQISVVENSETAVAESVAETAASEESQKAAVPEEINTTPKEKPEEKADEPVQQGEQKLHLNIQLTK